MSTNIPRQEGMSSPPPAETIFSFLQEMSDANTISYQATEAHTGAFMSYSIPVPEARRFEVGYDSMAIYVKSVSASDYKEALTMPNRMLAGITMLRIDLFPELQASVSTELASDYRIVSASKEGDLKLVKITESDEAEEASDLSTGERFPAIRKLLGRLGIGGKSEGVVAETRGLKPLGPDVTPEETILLFQLLQQGAAEKEARG